MEDIQKIKRSRIWPNNRNTNYIQRKHAQETSGVIYMWKQLRHLMADEQVYVSYITQQNTSQSSKEENLVVCDTMKRLERQSEIKWLNNFNQYIRPTNVDLIAYQQEIVGTEAWRLGKVIIIKKVTVPRYSQAGGKVLMFYCTLGLHVTATRVHEHMHSRAPKKYNMYRNQNNKEMLEHTKLKR